MYESGCIYRDNRLVNWDARLRTAVSDIEVDYIDVPGRTQINVPGYDKVCVWGGAVLGGQGEGAGRLWRCFAQPQATAAGDRAGRGPQQGAPGTRGALNDPACTSCVHVLTSCSLLSLVC